MVKKGARLAAVAAATALTLFSPSLANACISAEPSISDVATQARTIVVATITAEEQVAAAPENYEFRVERVLKGQAGPVLRLQGLVTNGCGDDILNARVGYQVVLALGVPWGDTDIAPVWLYRDDGSFRATTVAGGPHAFDAVVEALAGRLPDTSWTLPDTSGIPQSPEDRSGDRMAIVLAAVMAGSLLVLRLRPRSAPAL